MKKHDRQWFENRIGKKIYRIKTPRQDKCKCVRCVSAKVDGFFVGSLKGDESITRTHILWLLDHQGIGYRYGDKP